MSVNLNIAMVNRLQKPNMWNTYCDPYVNLLHGILLQALVDCRGYQEIRSSKQRSYTYVSNIQKSLEGALEQLVYAMDVYADLYDLAPSGDYELNCTWGDSVLEDTDKEFSRRLQLVTAGKLKPEKLLAWYFGVDEDTARNEYMPTKTELFNADSIRI